MSLNKVATLILTIVALLLIGCSRAATVGSEVAKEITVVVPQTIVIPETVVVRETVNVPQTVEVPVTVMVTATLPPTQQPSPTPRPSPTPAPTATLEVGIPDDWLTYEDIANEFTIRYPSRWSVESQDVGSVSFDIGSYGWLTVSLLPSQPAAPVGTEETVNELVRGVVGGEDELDTIILVGKGPWNTVVSGAFVELNVKDYVYESWANRLVVVAPVGASYTGLASAGRVSGKIGPGEREAMGLILASMRANESELGSDGGTY